ncbi:F-box protein CPR1-like [Lycium ferocissimum]|uniref:F-box protein CPR1-like n=1 Tax=Lycium ferocissimum TaxID=112874 RepID=UPI002815C92E|nr:F-box protein CPR1-like [Lycium ferocissimum]
MSDIPPEVISHIFSRLPVKSLLRFSCVSKPVKALIDSTKFIQAHLKQQMHKPNSLILKANNKAHNIFSVDNFSSTQQPQPKELDHPLNQPFGPTQVLGSCRGLLLISNNMSENRVWNPSTKMFRKLPVCHFNPESKTPKGRGPGLAQICGGFGYDVYGDDYKVVMIGQWYHPDDNLSLVSATMVYSLKFGGWKKVKEDCPYWLLKEDNGTFAGGALNWIVTKEPLVRSSPLILVGLNLGSERFEEMPFPENFSKPIQFNLAALGERLCLISGHVTNAKENVLDHVDVWMMKDRSWVKLFKVDQLEGRQHFTYLRPIAYSVTGKEVLMEMDGRKFLWYSLEKKSLKHAKISGGLDCFETFVSFDTLVPLYEKHGKKGIEERDVSVIEECKLEL